MTTIHTALTTDTIRYQPSNTAAPASLAHPDNDGNMFSDSSKGFALLGMVVTVLLMAYPSLSFADTAIETETAQIGKKGQLGISQSYEYGHAKDGTAGGTLTQFEYALSDRAELLIEPFFYTFEHPRNESKVQGLGDLEITPSYEFVLEHGWVPAILAAFKLKVPTGSKEAGGSGKFDYLPYFILGQHYRDWTFNCNVGINVVTPQDRGQKYKKADTLALEAERDITPNLGVLAEVFSTEDRVKTASGALEYKWNKVLDTFGVVGYTEDHEAIFRIGFNLKY